MRTRATHCCTLRALLAGFDQIESPGELGQWEAIVFDRGPAVVAGLVKRFAHGWPIDAAVARVHEFSAVAVRIELEIFDVQLGDERTELLYPILRGRVFHVVANVEIRLYPRMVEGSDEVFVE